jgi:hypothetical protein
MSRNETRQAMDRLTAGSRRLIEESGCLLEKHEEINHEFEHLGRELERMNEFERN